ncbi:uncharacterized protein LOC131234722 isoform X1 [Magnolia sinica]|uniref:uncharacterized protein LOC131234722 isoform X1 n=1 Tax=Magnolia sinica TaxID=86752 RepID=UPI00265A8249|nr:uncharacterized protein LOC131234722 isoform X1 [Magnolia sinica]
MAWKDKTHASMWAHRCGIFTLTKCPLVSPVLLSNVGVISDWMSLLLPLAMERGVCVITNISASFFHPTRKCLKLDHVQAPWISFFSTVYLVMIWKTTVRAYDVATLKYWGLATHINFLLLAGMHSLNAVFLLGDTALNSLRFPWFWIS